ncbi:hypothetical protein BKP35_03210 [Anaerobacillus arseniciselenatis]|uniref:DUF4142 domain-containing protein n=1 Tax=Anaerobacillus arseniciselenatis TaxID=85682 RepID=A0A1S2LUI2_9BACI|nr:hypothetical protein [Anaerobacillus arseniciselenatis]OIJ16006.1 hypothetical protein BKP35_03210 [Anaerobacillus arseniciselenatis]
MKCFQQKVIFSIVIATMLFSLTSVAFANPEGTQDDASTHFERVSYEQKAIRPHFNFYYQLLAEKYAPKHVKVWNEVLKDRDALLKKYREVKKAGKELEDFYDEEWLKEHSEIHQQFLEAVEKRDDDKLKEIVPRVIDHQKELNAMLKKRLKEIK